MFLLNQADELDSLVEWARRKRVKAGIRRYYEDLLRQAEHSLWKYRINSKWILFWAEWVHALKKALFPAKQYQKGFASKYSRMNLMQA